jgi:hypothetical protein
MERATKYHFFPRKSKLGFLKNSTVRVPSDAQFIDPLAFTHDQLEHDARDKYGGEHAGGQTDDHRGELEIDSTVGIGTKITIVLPMQQASEVDR